MEEGEREEAEGGRGREVGEQTSMGKRHIDWLPPPCAQPGLGIEPAPQVRALDQHSNSQPSDSQADALTTYQQPGLFCLFKRLYLINYE